MKTSSLLGLLACTAAPFYGQEIRISYGGQVIQARLNGSPSAQSFAAMLPLTLDFNDYQGLEKYAPLPKKLNLDGAPSGYKPSAGDIAQYAPWGNLILYYKDAPYAGGIVPLGKITSGLEFVQKMKGGEKVRIEAVQ